MLYSAHSNETSMTRFSWDLDPHWSCDLVSEEPVSGRRSSSQMALGSVNGLMQYFMY